MSHEFCDLHQDRNKAPTAYQILNVLRFLEKRNAKKILENIITTSNGLNA